MGMGDPRLLSYFRIMTWLPCYPYHLAVNISSVKKCPNNLSDFPKNASNREERSGYPELLTNSSGRRYIRGAETFRHPTPSGARHPDEDN